MRQRYIAVTEDSDEDFDSVIDAARCADILLPILRARCGGECLQLLRSSHSRNEALPVLLLLDLNLPGDDGRDVLRDLRSDAAFATLPVVVLSASANPRDLQFCYANGANAYHVKPVNYTMHLAVLRGIFDYWLRNAVLPA